MRIIKNNAHYHRPEFQNITINKWQLFSVMAHIFDCKKKNYSMHFWSITQLVHVLREHSFGRSLSVVASAVMNVSELFTHLTPRFTGHQNWEIMGSPTDVCKCSHLHLCCYVTVWAQFVCEALRTNILVFTWIQIVPVIDPHPQTNNLTEYNWPRLVSFRICSSSPNPYFVIFWMVYRTPKYKDPPLYH